MIEKLTIIFIVVLLWVIVYGISLGTISEVNCEKWTFCQLNRDCDVIAVEDWSVNISYGSIWWNGGVIYTNSPTKKTYKCPDGIIYTK